MDPASRLRAGVLGALFALLFMGLLARLYALQIVRHEASAAGRDAQQKGFFRSPGLRGDIRDVSGEILALSVPVESVWADPATLPDPGPAARALAGALGLPEERVRERLSGAGRDRPLRFVWIKRRVSAREAQAVRGLLARPEFLPDRRTREAKFGLATELSRSYPFGPLGAHLLGFESADERLHEGLERSMDKFLDGRDRVFDVQVDGRRNPLGGRFADPRGASVVLTINLQFQKALEEALDQACATHRPRWAVAVAIDPRTGAVLGLANRPGFDPNRPGDFAGDARRNRALVDPYEPGSTLKPFLAAFALDRGLARPDTKFDCENGLWKHGPRILHDHHPYGTLTLADGLRVSSNIFAAKLGALTLGRDRLHECLTAFGFGARTGIDLPAEDDGKLAPAKKWSIYTLTSVPIGHEIAVTPLQLACAMAAIANGGTLWRPYAILRVVDADGSVLAENAPRATRRVLGPKAAAQMVEILKSVVDSGTGKKAQVPGVAVAGKTGTTQKVDPRTGRYGHEKYISSFVGFAPAEEPRVCVAVVIDEPQGEYYGGAVAAPVVAEIIATGLIHVR